MAVIDNTIPKFYVDTFSELPNAVIFCGEIGSGGKTTVKKICSILNVPFEDITEKLSSEDILSFYTKPENTIYIINFDNLHWRARSAILKFLEEPPMTAKIFLLTESQKNIPFNIKGRCQLFEFKQFTPEELKNYSVDCDPKLFLYAKNPKQLEHWKKENVSDMEKFAGSILDNVSKANFANVLTIPNKIIFDSSDKGIYDVDLFSRVLVKIAKEKVKNENLSFEVFDLVNEYYNEYNKFNVNKRISFEHFLSKLKLLKSV